MLCPLGDTWNPECLNLTWMEVNENQSLAIHGAYDWRKGERCMTAMGFSKSAGVSHGVF